MRRTSPVEGSIDVAAADERLERVQQLTGRTGRAIATA